MSSDNASTWLLREALLKHATRSEQLHRARLPAWLRLVCGLWHWARKQFTTFGL